MEPEDAMDMGSFTDTRYDLQGGMETSADIRYDLQGGVGETTDIRYDLQELVGVANKIASYQPQRNYITPPTHLTPPYPLPFDNFLSDEAKELRRTYQNTVEVAEPSLESLQLLFARHPFLGNLEVCEYIGHNNIALRNYSFWMFVPSEQQFGQFFHEHPVSGNEDNDNRVAMYSILSIIKNTIS